MAFLCGEKGLNIVPKLEISRVTEILKLISDKEGFEYAISLLSEEQTQDFMIQMSFATMKNLECIRGFIVCYLAIREKLMAKEIDDLERLFRL